MWVEMGCNDHVWSVEVDGTNDDLRSMLGLTLVLMSGSCQHKETNNSNAWFDEAETIWQGKETELILQQRPRAFFGHRLAPCAVVNGNYGWNHGNANVATWARHLLELESLVLPWPLHLRVAH